MADLTNTEKLIIVRGLPASGKTTAARAWVAARPTLRARVNRDDLRKMLHDGGYSHETEQHVKYARLATIGGLLRFGVSVISDDTNLDDISGLAELGRVAGADVNVWDFRDVPLATCIERDAARAETVGEERIREMYAKYVAVPR